MAFLKYARAVVERPTLNQEDWAQVLKGHGNEGVFSKTASADLNKYTPDKYLLSHVTIIASVDVEEVPNVKIGEVTEGSSKVYRKWNDYYITPETSKYVNANQDAWDRQTLLNTYKTFIGAENYCFAPDTKVLMHDGTYKAILDVQVGDLVITHNGNVKPVVHKFERHYEGEVQEIYVDRFEKPIVATSNHPFYTVEVDTPDINTRLGTTKENASRYKKDQVTSYLRDGETYLGGKYTGLKSVVNYLLESPDSTVKEIQQKTGLGQTAINKYFRNYPEAFSSRKLKTGELQSVTGQARRSLRWKVLSQNLPVMEVSAKIVKSKISEIPEGSFLVGPNLTDKKEFTVGVNRAKLLGYYLAEGCQVRDKHEGVIFVFGKDEQYLIDSLIVIVEELYPNALIREESQNNTLRLIVRDKELSKWLNFNGGNLSHKKCLNPEVLSWNNEELIALLVSWLEGDGNYHKETSRVRGTTVSEKLAYQMQYISEKCGIKSSVVFTPKNIGGIESVVTYTRKDGSIQEANVRARNHVWELIISKGSVNKIFSNSKRWAALYQPEGVKRSDFAFWEGRRVHSIDKIKSKTYTGNVYNIEVEDDHSYVVDYGVSVSNCEHVQVAELSKGKIIDAVARDLGDTVYVDILVATDRKHTELIKDIESGAMSTLSMGCSIQYSRCSKCGNVAADEAQMCNCIKYEKGNYFHDAKGKKRIVAEICGHSEDPDSVTFIEASWVATPAFKGAVVRNLLNPTKGSTEAERQANAAKTADMLDSSPMMAEFFQAQNIDQYMRTANALSSEIESLRVLKEDLRQVMASHSKTAFGGFGDDDEEEGGEDLGPIEELKDEIKTTLREDIKKELRKELEDEMGLAQKEPFFEGPADSVNLNNNIIASFQGFTSRYASEIPETKTLRSVFNVLYAAKLKGWESVNKEYGVTNRDIVAAMYLRDRDHSNKENTLDPEIYACLSKVGGTANYTNVNAFLNACKIAMNRNVSKKEAAILIERAKVLK